MKRILFIGFFMMVAGLFGSTTADARFMIPMFRMNCSTAGTAGTPLWPVGCHCVQSGWIIGGMRIDDNVIGCHLGLGENDACNFHAQCTVFFGGGGGDISGVEDLLIKGWGVVSADSVEGNK